MAPCLSQVTLSPDAGRGPIGSATLGKCGRLSTHRIAVTASAQTDVTSALETLQSEHRSRGYDVYVVPSAIDILSEGACDVDFVSAKSLSERELVAAATGAVRLQMQLEDSFDSIAKSTHKPTVLLLSQPTLPEIVADLPVGIWEQVCEQIGNKALAAGGTLTFSRYDGVLHLVTAAFSEETAWDEAATKQVMDGSPDAIIAKCWEGHPHVCRVEIGSTVAKSLDKRLRRAAEFLVQEVASEQDELRMTILEAFRASDHECNGSISRELLAGVLRLLGPLFSKPHVETLLDMFDRNGCIEYEHFFSFVFMDNASGPTMITSRPPSVASMSISLDAEDKASQHEKRLHRCRGTARSLIAFDVDKTVLHQGEPDEMERFHRGVGQTLVRLARIDFRIAAVTGNSLHQLSTRFLKGIVEALCNNDVLELISRFHFFCNSAALYVWVDPERSLDLKDLLVRSKSLDSKELFAEAQRCIFDAKGQVLAAYISARYASMCCIPTDDASFILDICGQESQDWWRSIQGAEGFDEEIRSRFYIATGDEAADGKLKDEARADMVNCEASVYGPAKKTGPTASARKCIAGDGECYVTACNILPVLSFRHGRRVVLQGDDDPRLALIKRIKTRMEREGLVRYVVSPGGRGTIDISHHLVNKGDAVLWLIRKLGAEGVRSNGEPLGANAVFFGDEVVLNGNDLAVVDVPGILVFAVNELVGRVPFHADVELPAKFTNVAGPEATDAVLTDIALYAERCLKICDEPWAQQTALSAWRAQRLQARLEDKCLQLLDRKKRGPCTRFTFRRLQAAAAALTALTRHGDDFDELAEQICDMVNHIGMVHARACEHQIDALQAQRGAGIKSMTLGRPSQGGGDVLEDQLLLELGRPASSSPRRPFLNSKKNKRLSLGCIDTWQL